MKNFDRKKVVIIITILSFVMCVVFYSLSSKSKDSNHDSEIHTTEREENEVENNDGPPKSDFNLADIEVHYQGEEADINMKRLLTQNDQWNYFLYSLYEFLYERGYKKINKFTVHGGEITENGTIYYVSDFITEEAEYTVGCWYNESLYSFYFALDEELVSVPVKIINLDEEISRLFNDNLDAIEKDFGDYLFNAKVDATSAKVTNYEIKDNIMVIQTEVNDEYLTYCYIYYNMDEHTYYFKVWGE